MHSLCGFTAHCVTIMRLNNSNGIRDGIKIYNTNHSSESDVLKNGNCNRDCNVTYEIVCNDSTASRNNEKSNCAWISTGAAMRFQG